MTRAMFESDYYRFSRKGNPHPHPHPTPRLLKKKRRHFDETITTGPEQFRFEIFFLIRIRYKNSDPAQIKKLHSSKITRTFMNILFLNQDFKFCYFLRPLPCCVVYKMSITLVKHAAGELSCPFMESFSSGWYSTRSRELRPANSLSALPLTAAGGSATVGETGFCRSRSTS